MTTTDHSYAKRIRPVGLCSQPCGSNDDLGIDCVGNILNEFNSSCTEYVAPNYVGSEQNDSLLQSTLYNLTEESCTAANQQSEQQRQPQNIPQNYIANPGTKPVTEINPNDIADTQIGPSLFSPLSEFLNDFDFNENMMDVRELEEYLEAPNDALPLNTFELVMNEVENEGRINVAKTEDSNFTGNDNLVKSNLLKIS